MKNNHCMQILSYLLLLFSLALILIGEVLMLGAGSSINGIQTTDIVISYIVSLLGICFLGGFYFSFTMNINFCSKIRNMVLLIITELCFVPVLAFNIYLVYTSINSTYIFVAMMVLGLIAILCLFVFSVIFVIKYLRTFKNKE